VTRIAHLDLIGGVAGDMLMAALIDAGADAATVFEGVGALGLAHRDPGLESVLRGGFRALHLAGTPATGQQPRTLSEIAGIINAARLPDPVAARAVDVFRRLADAEARVHGQPVDAVVLHEAGDDDAIFDVVGVLIALRELEIEEVSSSVVPLGGGRSRSGMSWPGPAALEVLKGVPVVGPPPDAEATTPTGAALVAALATSFGSVPRMTLERTGYGAGSRDLPGVPNLLRVLVGTATNAPWIAERGLLVVEANIDDLSPQLMADAAQALFEAGALDVWQTPIQMKHGRLAFTLSALVAEADADRVKGTFFRTTTTLGVRHYPVTRSVLDREVDIAEIRGGTVRIKRGRLGGRVVTSMPEHADLETLAQQTGATVRELWSESLQAPAVTSGEPDAG
jgi:uncharacterized protein (TIGR00299 family) protein